MLELTALPAIGAERWVPWVREADVPLVDGGGDHSVEWPLAPDDRTLGVVDFSIFPHLNAFPTNTPAHAERWAARIGVPAYAIDEQTAIKVVDGSVEVGLRRRMDPVRLLAPDIGVAAGRGQRTPTEARAARRSEPRPPSISAAMPSDAASSGVIQVSSRASWRGSQVPVTGTT